MRRYESTQKLVMPYFLSASLPENMTYSLPIFVAPRPVIIFLGGAEGNYDSLGPYLIAAGCGHIFGLLRLEKIQPTLPML